MREVTEENERFLKEKEEHIRLLNRLQFKLHFGDAEYKLEAEKTDTLETLLLQAYKETGIEQGGITFEKCRLRRYNYNKQVGERPFSHDDLSSPLAEGAGNLGLRNLQHLLLETVDPATGEFPVYRPPQMSLTLVALDEKTGELKEKVEVTVDEEGGTVGQLRANVAKLLSAAPENVGLVLLERKTVKVLNDDSRVVRVELDLRSGDTVYAEIKASKEAPSVLQEQLEQQLATVTVFYTDVDSREPAPHSVAVDTRKPLSWLKQHISSVLKKPEGEFKLKRGPEKTDEEFKDLDRKMSQFGFLGGTVIHVVSGAPMRKDERIFRVFVVDETPASSSSALESKVSAVGNGADAESASASQVPPSSSASSEVEEGVAPPPPAPPLDSACVLPVRSFLHDNGRHCVPAAASSASNVRCSSSGTTFGTRRRGSLGGEGRGRVQVCPHWRDRSLGLDAFGLR